MFWVQPRFQGLTEWLDDNRVEARQSGGKSRLPADHPYLEMTSDYSEILPPASNLENFFGFSRIEV